MADSKPDRNKRAWREADDKFLIDRLYDGEDYEEIAAALQRTKLSITSRVAFLRAAGTLPPVGEPLKRPKASDGTPRQCTVTVLWIPSESMAVVTESADPGVLAVGTVLKKNGGAR